VFHSSAKQGTMVPKHEERNEETDEYHPCIHHQVTKLGMVLGGDMLSGVCLKTSLVNGSTASFAQLKGFVDLPIIAWCGYSVAGVAYSLTSPEGISTHVRHGGG